MLRRASWALSAIVLFSGCSADDNTGGPYFNDPGGSGPQMTPVVSPMPDVPVIAGVIGAACSGPAGCQTGLCLGPAFHPDFAQGYCSAFCKPNEERGCGVQARCVSARVGICLRACDALNPCLNGQLCVARTCVPDSISMTPKKTDMIPAHDRTLAHISAAVDPDRLMRTIRILSGARALKPLSTPQPNDGLFGPAAGNGTGVATGAIDPFFQSGKDLIGPEPGDGSGPDLGAIDPFFQSGKDLIGPEPGYGEDVAIGAIDPYFDDTEAEIGIEIRSRAVVHPDHAVAQAWLISQLRALNLEVETQTFPYVRQPLLQPGEVWWEGGRKSGPKLTMITNLRAVLPGSQPELPRVLVTAHYDSTAWLDDDYTPNASPAPGAADNATGVAAVLEIARVLTGLEQPLRRTVEFVLFDAEENGWSGFMFEGQTGSRRYVGALPQNATPFCTLNLDGMAWRMLNTAPRVWLGLDPEHMLLGELGNEAIRDTIPDLGMVTTRADAFFNVSDHTSFMARGMCSAVIYSWPPSPNAGTQYDTIMSIDDELLDKAVKAAGVVVGAWANHRFAPIIVDGE